jgi:hypothetical protein
MGTLRYTILLDDAASQGLEALRKAYGLKNKAEVYELAVRVLAWTTDQEANGYEVGRFKDGSFQPLLLPYKVKKDQWLASEHAAATTT